MVMGRPNKGVGHVDRCDGSEQSKQRLQLILRTMTGELSVEDACDQLGVQRSRFAELRNEALQGAVDALEPGRPGRPRLHDPEVDAETERLEVKLRDMERQILLRDTKIELTEALLEGREVDQKGGAITRQERRKIEREVRKRRRG